ncbi:QacE family quaternary ammonium compound efflux SMR transporter [Campylobacter coli]|uniref:Spermidine export protein MdtJ n=2 Tax=Campylobacter coli TaxID=195 RepID=A0A5Y8BAA4_CAMCO|nr:SMR family transporter [Campylobacter coli]EDA0374949.1 EamA family transporter [Campylobacter jejuni]EAH5392929.1 QacE family quaternary ammonium compound efflux SMR transporter [Campylobacter coli]EAH5628349.1 QacE family quaternary ammonium compound efflux SMR transporter [Campylobacter coli]EAH6678405.1 QacE family quaternary ammonium compound efflux SMR transporter [Campylobacter coli]EAH6680413.1 QacE family quaternary ammonium compound efflux SMR transporter [Campylobacter coli]
MILPFIFRRAFLNLIKKELFIAWFFLISAIVFEVLGTSFLKMENQILGYIFMALFIAFSYFFMGKAIKKIQVGIAYAVWELLGIILILLVSFILFKESLTSTQMLGIALSIIGIILINIGEVKE